MNKYVYIHKGEIHEYLEDISSAVSVSINYDEQQNSHIQLNEQQINFYYSNKNASVFDIWNCTLSSAFEPIITPAQQREQSYRNDKVIEWQGEMLTCDEARLNRMSAYYYSGQTEKLAQLQQLWLDARESIQMQYPDDNGTI